MFSLATVTAGASVSVGYNVYISSISVLFYFKPTSSIRHHRRPSLLAKSECAESCLKTFSKSNEVLQCFHNIGVLTVERHSCGKSKVRGFQDMFLKKAKFFEEHCA